MAGSVYFEIYLDAPAGVITITKAELYVDGAWVDYTGSTVTVDGISSFVAYTPGVGYQSASGDSFTGVEFDAILPVSGLPTQARVTAYVSGGPRAGGAYMSVIGAVGSQSADAAQSISGSSSSPSVITVSLPSETVGAPWQPQGEIAVPFAIDVFRPVMDYVQISITNTSGTVNPVVVTKLETLQGGVWTDRTGDAPVPATGLGGLVEYEAGGYRFGNADGVNTTLAPNYVESVRFTWYWTGPSTTSVTFLVGGRGGEEAYFIGPYQTAVSSAGSALETPIVTTISGIDFSPFDVGAADLPYAFVPFSITISPPVAARVSVPFRVEVSAPARASVPLAITVSAPLADPGEDPWPASPSRRWRPVVVLDGADLSARLHGEVRVEHADNQAATAEFAFQPVAAYLPDNLIGRPVRIAFADQSAAVAHTIYTGVIDVASIDINTGLISCTCHDQLQEMAANLPREWIDAEVGGSWHVAIDGEPDDNRAYLEQRIASAPKSYAIDPLGAFRVLPWRGAPLRTETIGDGSYFDGSVSVDMPGRSEIVTRVEVRSEYRYERLRVRGALAQYQQPLAFFQPAVVAGSVVVPGKDLLTTAMVQGATDSLGGWELVKREIDNPPSGQWNLGTELNPYIYRISPNVAPSIALGFRAWYASRWTQTITEDYTLTVACQALEAQLGGPVQEQMGASLQAEFDQQDWERDSSVAPYPLAVLGEIVGDIIEPYQPAGSAPADRTALMTALLDRARMRIYSSTRTGRAAFDMPLRPDLWLDWFVTLEAPRVRVAGKVASVSHLMSIETGEATTSVQLAFGLPGNTDAAAPVWTLPDAPTDPYTPPPSAYSCEIGTYVGGDEAAPEWDDETMIGFSTNYEGVEDPAYNYYPHQLRILSPALAAEDRDALELPAAAQYEIDIPTDLLEIL